MAMFNLETARKILVDILKHIALPESSRRLQEAKGVWLTKYFEFLRSIKIFLTANSGREMIKMMQIVFPIVMELQMDVLKNYGFVGREGLVHFEQLIREMEADDEIARLRQQVRNSYLPPMTSASSPDVLI
jgi:Protein C10